MDAGQSLQQGIAQQHELGGDHREHLDVDSVELVKTGPTARGRYPCEEFLHHFDVDLV